MAQFKIGKKHEVMGSALCIGLPAGLKSGQYIDAKVSYRTTNDSTALQWLDKELVVFCSIIHFHAQIPACI